MGMYDVVQFSCPNCNSMIEVQSKAGGCTLTHFDCLAVPREIAMDIEGEVVACADCKRTYTPWSGLQNFVPMKLI